MSSNTKVYEEKMKSSVEHLGRELAAVRAGRANPAVLDKVTVDYYGAPTPIQQVASVAVSEARTLTITPWDRTLLRAISKAIMASDVGINPIAIPNIKATPVLIRNKEIADKLNISLTTVISHRKNITEKLGIKSVSGLAIYAVMHGYVEADRI